MKKFAEQADELESQNRIENQTFDHVTNVKNRAISGFISMAAREVVIGLLYIGANIALSHIFNEKLYGAFFFFHFSLILYTSFTETGFAGTIIRQFVIPDQRELSTIFWVQQFIVLLLVLVLALIAAPLSNELALGEGGIWTVYGLAIGFFISSLRTIPSALLERDLHYRQLALVEVTQAIIFYGGTVALALLGWGIWSFAAALIVRNFVAVAIVYLLKPWRPSFIVSKEGVTAVITFGLPYQLVTIVSQLKDSLIPVLTLLLFGAVPQSYLGWALTQAEIPSRLAHVVGRIVFPTFSRLQNDKQAVKVALETSLSLLFLTAGAFTLGFAVLSTPLIRYVFGEKWEPANTAFILFSITMLGGYITTPFIPLLSALGHVRAALFAASGWLVLSWTLGFIFSPVFGYNGIALASAIATLVIATILGGLVYRQIKFNFWKSLRSTVYGFGPVGILLWLVEAKLTSFWLLALAAAVGSIVYLGLIILFEGRNLKATLASLAK